MMLLALALALKVTAPQGCTDVKNECRVCTTRDGKRVCSNIGIACQPSIRICDPKVKPALSESDSKLIGMIS